MSDELMRYRTGYSIGVGAIVLHNDEILLVRHTYGDTRVWMIPGGYVEPNETIEHAIAREVLEETGVETSLTGLLGVRHRVVQNKENSAYFIFLMRATLTKIRLGKEEISEARFIPLLEVLQMYDLNALTRLLVEHLHKSPEKYLSLTAHPTFPRDEFVLYL
jgi:8-oxo-dGTP diphosphatase